MSESAVLERRSVVAHRASVQGLAGGANPESVGVLDLGVQDAPAGSANLALAVRTGDPRADDDPRLARVLILRGAPQSHPHAGGAAAGHPYRHRAFVAASARRTGGGRPWGGQSRGQVGGGVSCRRAYGWIGHNDGVGR